MTYTIDEPVWVSKANPLLTGIWLLIVGPIICIVLASDWGMDFLSEKYLPLDNGIVIISLLIILACCLYWVYMSLVPRYTLYQDRLVMQAKNKPELSWYMTDLQNWSYHQSPSRSGPSNLDLVEFEFNDRKVKINPYICSNLTTLKEQLIKSYPDAGKEISKSFIWNFIPNVIVLLFLGGLFYTATGIQRAININKGTQTISLGRLVLSDDPGFIRHSHKGSPTSYEMRLKVKGVKDFEFMINNIGHSEDKNSLEQSLHKNDTIDLSILEYDNDIKLANTREPTFWDKHFGWTKIKIKHINCPGIDF